MLKYWLILVALVIAGVYCLHAIAFFAWVATAPGSPEIHEQARSYANLWTTGLVAALASLIAIVWRMVVRERRTQKGVLLRSEAEPATTPLVEQVRRGRDELKKCF